MPDISKQTLDTPALCLDLDVLDSNVARMAATCRENGVDWRPHCKCHKSSWIASKLTAAGAIGVTCAKLSEAEVMAQGGVTDLLIANQIVGPQKVSRLVELRGMTDPVICVDHVDQAAAIGEAMSAAGLSVRTLIEVNIGLNRAGVLPGEPTLQLARYIDNAPGLTLSGVMGYEGHLLIIEDLQEKKQRIHAALDQLLEMKNLLERAGLDCPIVSCGGTGSYIYSATHKGITEIQAGGGMFMDLFYRNCCQVPDLDFAVTVLTTVVGRPAPDRAIIDAGRKTLNQELHMPAVAGRGDLTIQGLSAEHGTVSLSPDAKPLDIGDRLELVPGYVDFTTVLHDRFYAFRGDQFEREVPVEARGKIQ